MTDIQVQMSERAIELLSLLDDEPHFLLDLGCGSGISGSVLEDQGHTWVGIDISSAMLGELHLHYGRLVYPMRYEF
jgi:18S rRNA (guanine1575-N7)-methyltransferase